MAGPNHTIRKTYNTKTQKSSTLMEIVNDSVRSITGYRDKISDERRDNARLRRQFNYRGDNDA